MPVPTPEPLVEVILGVDEAVVVLDAAGKISFASDTAQKLLRNHCALTRGASFSSAIADDHPLAEHVEAVLRTGGELRNIPLQLTGAFVLASILHLGAPDPNCILVLLRDLTPILDLQNAFDKRYREEWLPASLQNVAHQLRSLLQGMKLRVELLAADNGEAKDRHIGRLRNEITRLDQAVDLLASGKLTE